jgi:hypothetical protein
MSAPALHDSFLISTHAPPPLLEKITTPSHLSTMGSIPPPNTDLQVFYDTHPADQNWVNEELIPFLDLVYGPKARGFWTQKIGEITLQLPELVHLHPSSTSLFLVSGIANSFTIRKYTRTLPQPSSASACT